MNPEQRSRWAEERAHGKWCSVAIEALKVAGGVLAAWVVVTYVRTPRELDVQGLLLHGLAVYGGSALGVLATWCSNEEDYQGYHGYDEPCYAVAQAPAGARVVTRGERRVACLSLPVPMDRWRAQRGTQRRGATSILDLLQRGSSSATYARASQQPHRSRPRLCRRGLFHVTHAVEAGATARRTRRSSAARRTTTGASRRSARGAN